TSARTATLKGRRTSSSGPLSNEGIAGGNVTIAGKTFIGTTSAKSNGLVSATSAIGVGGTSLNVTVPPAAQSGPISVTNAGGTSSTGNFTIDPRVSSFTPASGSTGIVMTIAGSGLLGADRVDFTGGSSAVPTNVTATSLKV